MTFSLRAHCVLVFGLLPHLLFSQVEMVHDANQGSGNGTFYLWNINNTLISYGADNSSNETSFRMFEQGVTNPNHHYFSADISVDYLSDFVYNDSVMFFDLGSCYGFARNNFTEFSSLFCNTTHENYTVIDPKFGQDGDLYFILHAGPTDTISTAPLVYGIYSMDPQTLDTTRVLDFLPLVDTTYGPGQIRKFLMNSSHIVFFNTYEAMGMLNYAHLMYGFDLQTHELTNVTANMPTIFDLSHLEFDGVVIDDQMVIQNDLGGAISTDGTNAGTRTLCELSYNNYMTNLEEIPSLGGSLLFAVNGGSSQELKLINPRTPMFSSNIKLGATTNILKTFYAVEFSDAY
jgi:hypothetical protein